VLTYLKLYATLENPWSLPKSNFDALDTTAMVRLGTDKYVHQ
jgi:hypothetical protein